MKKLIIFLLFMPQLFYGQWVQQFISPTASLNDIYCVSETNVFVVGGNGTILNTTDGGINWMPKNSGTSQFLNKVQFANSNFGLILCGDGTIIKSTNGGQNWSPISFTNIKDFSIVNESIFYVTKLDGKLYKTINSGLTFQLINSNENIANIQFLNENIGYENYMGLGITGVNLRKTIDGGISWNIIYNNITASYFLNENIGFIKTGNGLYKTTNGGVNFTQLGSNINGIGIVNKIYSKNENVIWGFPVQCLLNGTPCYSIRGEILNNGSFDLNIFLVLQSMHFANQNIGYGIGNGEIYKNSTGLLNNNIINKIEEFKIYPNPAKNLINVSFSDIQTENYKIEINDHLGKNIFSKSFNFENNISINTQEFATGIYFLTVSTSESKQTEKLIIN